MGDGPRLRAVEVFPVRVDGRDLVCLRDPTGLSESVLTMPPATLEILALLDGTRTVLDIQADLMRRHGTLVPRADIERLLATLDEHLFLDTERFRAERDRVRQAFARDPVRRAFHAGRAYPAETTALTTLLDACFTHPDGPGPVGPRRAPTLRGLVAPHIDYARGGPAYAWAYREVAEASDADCYVIFGTAHAGLDGYPFAATRKAYATPFGAVEVDEEVLEAVLRRAPADLLAAEAAHRSEHSIEFQAVCLAYVARRWQGRPPPRIVPLLASFTHECLARGIEPPDDPAVAGTLEAVRAALATVPRRYCVVAGADLAHVGPRFGDPQPVSAGWLARVEAEDRALLARVEAGDAAGFFWSVAADGDRRRICGFSPIYALLATLPEGRGRLLRYGRWPDPQGTVTYASVAFEVAP